ncbi:MAG TPA: hypothetical protein DCR27_08765 [Lachnospiraceae bacterium]|nr:hypothetical protein [Lachnospiraceae bacterium]
MKKRVFIFCMVCILLSSFLPAEQIQGSYFVYNIHNETLCDPETGKPYGSPNVNNYREFSKNPYSVIWSCQGWLYNPKRDDSPDYRNRRLRYKVTVKNTGKNEIKELGFCFNTASNGDEGECPYAYHMKKDGFSAGIKADNRHKRAKLEKGSIKPGKKKTIYFSYGIKENAIGIGTPLLKEDVFPICMYIPNLSGKNVYKQGDEITILDCIIYPNWYIIKEPSNRRWREPPLYVGQKRKISVRKGLGKLKWKSKNKKVATVSQKGKITAKKPGWITINVTGYQVKDEYNNWVEKPCFKKKKVVINRGRRKRLKLNAGSGKKKYKSSNPAIATVSSKGVVRGRRKGRTVITAKYCGYKMKCRVTVK